MKSHEPGLRLAVLVAVTICSMALLGHRINALAHVDLAQRMERLNGVYQGEIPFASISSAFEQSTRIAEVYSFWSQAVAVSSIFFLIVLAMRIKELRWSGILSTFALILYLCLGTLMLPSH